VARRGRPGQCQGLGFRPITPLNYELYSPVPPTPCRPG
jgi:hypothetical protein